MLPRPSNKEITNKIRDAENALQKGAFMFGTTKHLSGDLEGLELDSSEQLPALLLELVREIYLADPVKCYAGGKPPQRSYEKEILGLELWAYKWQSKRCGKMMYLKFAFRNGQYIYVDCHEDRI